MGNEIEILIAEDDQGHFILTRKYLQEQGIKNKISWFPDGQQVVDFFFNADSTPKKLNGTQYVLLLDLRMPVFNGMDILKMIRGTSSFMTLPVIVLAASDNPEVIEEAYDLGADAYIVKPVKYSTYIDAMRKVGLFPSAVEDGVILRPKKTQHILEVIKNRPVHQKRSTELK